MTVQARSSHTSGASNGKHGANGFSNGATNGHSKENGGTQATEIKVNGGLSDLWGYTLGPLILISIMPSFTQCIWYAATHCNGSYQELLKRLFEHGPIHGLATVWGSVNMANPLAAQIVLGYMLFAVILQLTMPGPRVEGPLTPKGNVPVYKDNGFTCYCVTLATFFGLTYWLKMNGMTPTIVYDIFGDLLAFTSMFSLVFCVILCIKGRLAPSTTDCGSSGNVIFDYYWGTELYPRIFGIDIKVFTNCRFGMTVWPLLVLTFALKNYELYGFVDSVWVSTILQMAYFTKFFWWESGYMRTIDIMVDRAGFYICWGCLVYVPGLYASVSLYLANHPVRLGPFLSLTILVVGLTSIAVNYIADWQKQAVRNSRGQCQIWGQQAEFIRAKYRLENGDVRESLLLTSGWWGVARHFHYVPELALALCWTLPALFTHLMAYSYFIFLFILLVHRTYRDDEKCGKKYTLHWNDYCKKVPYKMVPGLF